MAGEMEATLNILSKLWQVVEAVRGPGVMEGGGAWMLTEGC